MDKNIDVRSTYPKIGDVLCMRVSHILPLGSQRIEYEVVGIKIPLETMPASSINSGNLELKLLTEKRHVAILEQIDHYALFNWFKYFEVVNKDASKEPGKNLCIIQKR